MSLADLQALARQWAPEPVTRVTHNPLPRGYKVKAHQTEENDQVQRAVTPVTLVTHARNHVGEDERTAPANQLVVTGQNEADDKVLPAISLAEMVEAMAEAMAANPVYQITNREKAMEYVRANALTRLSVTADPSALKSLLHENRC